MIRDGPKHTFAADSFQYLNAACQARHEFISWLIQGSPVAETLLCLARERNKTPDKVFLEQAVHFLTSEKYKADRSSVCHGLWRALVARTHGGAQFNKLMSDELQDKVLDGILNVHLVSPKANRQLREVLDRILPSELCGRDACVQSTATTVW